MDVLLCGLRSHPHTRWLNPQDAGVRTPHYSRGPEARRYRMGWIWQSFRRQVSINPALSWNTLEPSLQAATILGQRTSDGMLCTICQECDHTNNQCAMAPFQQQLQPLPPVITPAAPYRPPRRPETLQRICVAWNKGTCGRPQCAFRHICATCRGSHKARDCAETPPDSEYKTVASTTTRARK